MKTLVSVIFAAVLFAVQPATAADELVRVPNLVGMKNGNDIVAMLGHAGLKWEFGDPILPPDASKSLTIAKQFPEGGKMVPPGSLVIVIAYTKYAPSVVGLQLDKAVAKLEAEGVRVGSVLESDPAPTPELAGTVVYQLPPDDNNAVSIKVYAPFSALGTETAPTIEAQPSTGTPPGAGGGAGLISAGCRSPGQGVVIATSVNTPCSLNVGAIFGAQALAISDMRLEGQPSHGKVVWSNGILNYTPAPDYRGPDSITISTPKNNVVDGKLVPAGRQNQVWKIVVE